MIRGSAATWYGACEDQETPGTPRKPLGNPSGNPSGNPLETLRKPLTDPPRNPLKEPFGIQVEGATLGTPLRNNLAHLRGNLSFEEIVFLSAQFGPFCV